MEVQAEVTEEVKSVSKSDSKDGDSNSAEHDGSEDEYTKRTPSFGTHEDCQRKEKMKESKTSRGEDFWKKLDGNGILGVI